MSTPAPVTPAATLPVALIGGWLGAGKTTLVNALLRRAEGLRIAVLVNDFGSVAIDAELIDGPAAGGVLALSGGCLCCSFGDDLVGTLDRLAERQPAPELALIELSGVALPGLVASTARLSRAVDEVLTLVLADATLVRAQADDRYIGDTVRRQLEAADWLLLTKADLADLTMFDDTRRWLSETAPQARLLPGSAAEPPLALLRPPRIDRSARADDRAAAFAARPMAAPAAAAFDSRSFELTDGIDREALRHALAAPGVLRAKGLLRDCAGRDFELQLAGARFEWRERAFEGPGRLVVIALRGRLPDLQGCAARPADA